MDVKKPEEINTHPTFESLFPINPAVLEKIEQDMRDGRYDVSQLIILAIWQGQEAPVVIDGHTRLQAAINEGIEQVPVWLHEFDTEEEAIEKAIKLQRNRRNMTDAEIVTCIEVLDHKRARGGDRRSETEKSKASGDAIEKSFSKSAKETADLLGISTTKVERNRSILNNGDPATIEAVKNGEMSMNKGYQETQEKKRKAKSDKSTKNSKQQATDHGPKPKHVDQVTESACAERGPISKEHYEALRELGGCIEEHVASAIDLYLESRRAEYRGIPPETEQDNGYEEQSDPDADDEEEYLDLDEYGDE